eukprot:2811044-Amphidinium_carterae.1
MPRFATHRHALRERRNAEEQQRQESCAVEAEQIDRERQAMLVEEIRTRDFLLSMQRACQERAASGLDAEVVESARQIMLTRQRSPMVDREKRHGALAPEHWELTLVGSKTKSKALQSALELAAAQQQQREREAPQKAEKELWDTMLARNRMRLKQERHGQLTPRWGVL